jgi:putative ABC transport system permease protein
MTGFWQDVRVGLRTMVQRPGFTLAVVLALGIGIGANTAMFGILNAALIRPLPFPEPDRLVFGYTIFDGGTGLGFVSAPDYFDCRDEADAFESLAATSWYDTQSTVSGSGSAERVNSSVVSFDLFPTLGVSPVLGRGFGPEDAKPGAPAVAVVSHGLWQRRLGGSPEAIGSALNVNGQPYTVVGVMPGGFRIRSDTDLWTPMVDDPASHLPRRMHNWNMVGRLRPGVTLEQARAQVDAIGRRLQQEYPGSNRNKGLGLTSLHDALVSSDRDSLIALMAAVALVLLIACANVAGLLLARGSTRRRELAVRAALGGSWGRLARQLLTETAVLAAAAGVAGLLLASWLQVILLRVTPLESLGVTEIGMDATVLVFALALSVTTALVSGLVPALRSGRAHPAVDLHAGARTTDTRAGTRARAALITGQVALSLVLLVCAGLLIRSLGRLHAVDLGFQTDRLVTAEIELPPARYTNTAQRASFATTLLERTRALPGVRHAGLITLLPLREARNNTGVWVPHAPPTEDAPPTSVFIRSVLPGYFEAMGVPLLSGRDIGEGDGEDTGEVIVVNASLVRSLFPDRDPLGHDVVIDYPGSDPATARIVGVVGDVRLAGPRFPAPPVLYASFLQRQTDAEMQLAVRTEGEPEVAVGPLRTLVRELDPEVPLTEVATMDHFLGRWLSDHRTVTALVSTFAVFAVLLAALGLYGMLSFYVGQRTREIGVRMALGAGARELLAMVVRRGMRLVLIGVALGVAGSWAAARLLGHLLHGVPPTDPATLGVSALVFLVVGLIACLLPAWRATRIDPALSLSAE